ncbi:MAG: ATP-binding protein [Bacteroidales bacterium]|nr:ATP-binding protein [Bacteroidales bacterium]
MKNPFQYGKIAENANFIDRENDRAFLKQALSSNLNVILISPRRWGKSSLVKQAMKELSEEEKDIRVCFIDAYVIRSSTEFYETFAREVLKSCGSQIQSVIDDIARFLRTISPKISVSAGPDSEMSFSLDMSRGNKKEMDEVLNLPEKMAKEKGIRIIVCIDEFQRLALLPDYEEIESRMRSVWQHHQNASYCLYGSQRHMMSDIFDSSEKPFYRFGQIYPLQKINRDDWINYIIERFASTGKSITAECAGIIVDTVDRHSWYVQQLSSAVWNLCDSVADEVAIEKAIRWCIDINAESYQILCESMPSTQINLLRAIVCGERELSSSSVLEKYRLGTSANVIKNKKILVREDVISFNADGATFLDPMFRLWVKDNFAK